MNTIWAFGDSFTAGHGCKPFGRVEHIGTDKENYLDTLYKDYIDLNKKIWPEIVSEHLNMSLNNLGINGLSNESIFDNILKNIFNFNKNDIVLIQTSTSGRYPFPFLKDKSLFGIAKKSSICPKSSNIYEIDSSPYFLKTIFVSNIESEWNDGLINSLKYTNAQENITNDNLLLNKTRYNIIRNFFAEFISTKKYYEINIWRFLQISNILNNMGIKNYIINEDMWPHHLSKPSNLIEMHLYGMTGYVDSNKKTIKHETGGAIDDNHPGYSGHIDISNFIIDFIENENINIHNT